MFFVFVSVTFFFFYFALFFSFIHQSNAAKLANAVKGANTTDTTAAAATSTSITDGGKKGSNKKNKKKKDNVVKKGFLDTPASSSKKPATSTTTSTLITELNDTIDKDEPIPRLQKNEINKQKVNNHISKPSVTSLSKDTQDTQGKEKGKEILKNGVIIPCYHIKERGSYRISDSMQSRVVQPSRPTELDVIIELPSLALKVLQEREIFLICEERETHSYTYTCLFIHVYRLTMFIYLYLICLFIYF